ncbi:hypothetical protein SMICM304S_03906 [Streptomyces microflavus]
MEDDAGDALLVEEMLTDSELDSALTWRKSLAEARAFLRTCATPVCVLLDLHLPDVNGLDAVRQILESDSDAAIVVLTGLDESGTGLRAVAGGAQDYLVKGRLDPEMLSRAIRYALQRKEVERAAAALRSNQLIAQENARLERGLLPVPLLRDDRFQARARYEPGARPERGLRDQAALRRLRPDRNGQVAAEDVDAGRRATHAMTAGSRERTDASWTALQLRAGVRGNGHRPRALPEDHRVPRWPDLAGRRSG